MGSAKQARVRPSLLQTIKIGFPTGIGPSNRTSLGRPESRIFFLWPCSASSPHRPGHNGIAIKVSSASGREWEGTCPAAVARRANGPSLPLSAGRSAFPLSLSIVAFRYFEQLWVGAMFPQLPSCLGPVQLLRRIYDQG
jgi:hypothetical protein